MGAEDIANVYLFQSTRPVWGATPIYKSRVISYNISIHAPRVGRDRTGPLHPVTPEPISIHAPRVGRDYGRSSGRLRSTISIHAPRVGRDERTISIRREITNFNPRAPCGARRCAATLCVPVRRDFNPRAPCGARPPSHRLSDRCGRYFNPRAPCGARPDELRHMALLHAISIHAPRVGRDRELTARVNQVVISIHAPRVGRDVT